MVCQRRAAIECGMSKMRKDATYQAKYGPLMMIIAGEGDRLSITLHDLNTVPSLGSIQVGYADTIEEAKQQATEAARRYLERSAPAGEPEWIYFPAPGFPSSE